MTYLNALNIYISCKVYSVKYVSKVYWQNQMLHVALKEIAGATMPVPSRPCQITSSHLMIGR